MNAFSLFKNWAVVALLICTSNLCLASDDAADKDLLNERIQACISKSAYADDPKIKSMTDQSGSCTSKFPSWENTPGNKYSREEIIEQNNKLISCEDVARCISSAKTGLERLEGKCDTAIKQYNEAWEKFDKACGKTGVSDCQGAAKDCQNKRTSLVESGTFADTLNNTLLLYGQVQLNRQANANSQTITNNLNKCPQLSYKGYYERKKELDERIDKKKKEVLDTKKDVEKKKEEVNKAKSEATEAIKKLDEDIAKNEAELAKDIDESKRKALDADNKAMQAERDMLQKVTKLHGDIEKTAYQAGIDSKLMKQRMGLEPSDVEKRFSCVAGVKTKIAEAKAAASGPATKKTKELRETLATMFNKCMAQQDLAYKENRAKEAKAAFDLRAKMNDMSTEADQLNEEINRLKSQGLIKDQMDDKTLKDLQTASDQKKQNLQISRYSSLENSNEKIRVLQESIGANGLYLKKIDELNREILLANNELAGLGPIPPADYESSSYKDTTATWDRLRDAETLLGKYKESCREAKALLDKSVEVRYNKSSGSSGSSSGGSK